MDNHQPNNVNIPTWNSEQTVPRFILRNNVFHARDELFSVFFRRVAIGYARTIPNNARRVIEFGFLLQACFVLAIFIHLHIVFIKSPITCLDHLVSPVVGNGDSASIASDQSVKGWSRYGVLRLEVIRNPSRNYSLDDSYAKEIYGSIMDQDERISEEDESDRDGESGEQGSVKGELIKPVSNRQKLLQHVSQFWNSLRSLPHLLYTYAREKVTSVYRKTLSNNADSSESTADEITEIKPFSLTELFRFFGNRISNFVNSIMSYLNISEWIANFNEPTNNENNFIMEYAVEYGFLRLSPSTRKHLNIPVHLVVLDPANNTCFGGFISRFLMEEFLGYDEILLGSIKRLALRESVKGHMVNVITGQHYRLVYGQTTRSSYIIALLVMSLFTFCVSVLLRYSSHQLVAVVADLLQVFEGNLSVGIPGTPFMTIILALVAVETIMSEFFGDSFTAFYVIMIVSLCDHYQAVFCRSPISQRYWPRFFYIYQFSFYAYHYRFHGQLSSMALWVSWLFTLHSMIYFFHHYELPNLLSDWTVRDLLVREVWMGAEPIQMRLPITVSPVNEANASPRADAPTGTSADGGGGEGEAPTVRLRQRRHVSSGDILLLDEAVTADRSADRNSNPAALRPTVNTEEASRMDNSTAPTETCPQTTHILDSEPGGPGQDY